MKVIQSFCVFCCVDLSIVVGKEEESEREKREKRDEADDRREGQLSNHPTFPNTR